MGQVAGATGWRYEPPRRRPRRPLHRSRWFWGAYVAVVAVATAGLLQLRSAPPASTKAGTALPAQVDPTTTKVGTPGHGVGAAASGRDVDAPESAAAGRHDPSGPVTTAPGKQGSSGSTNPATAAAGDDQPGAAVGSVATTASFPTTTVDPPGSPTTVPSSTSTTPSETFFTATGSPSSPPSILAVPAGATDWTFSGVCLSAPGALLTVVPPLGTYTGGGVYEVEVTSDCAWWSLSAVAYFS